MRRATWRDGAARSAWWRWGPLVLWMAVISTFSTEPFSAQETSRFLFPLLRWLLPGASPVSLDLIHLAIRKGMHVTEFAILALLWYRALDWYGSKRQTKAALAAFVLAAGFGALDEAHQMFVASRTASIVDVGWDSLGAVLGLLARHVIRV